jgi:hypothetical protein
MKIYKYIKPITLEGINIQLNIKRRNGLKLLLLNYV